MQRDMDLVRKILFAIADSPTSHPPEPLKVEGYTDQQIGYHVMLMAQAGLVDAMNATSSATKGPYWKVRTLTWDGHDFLEAARDEGTWNTAKAVVSKAGGFAFDVLKAMLVKIIADQASAAWAARSTASQ